ncbi:hypothetical protein [Kurthia sibirica]|uniref:Formylmethanofuran dehydrogenase subunit E domain-containing protein n=1 Tax=Kurthia sibirica TaxID=202750 RepID=A0A2U3AJT4_9BACL|nr:hypothetical protein [Kurthia sibirica]PWI24777.1 hypothetical protein DEX24_11665 [Kurthia sibirica]GEK34877.1 hypothetical protein KSI01_24100 [Kurthia sibirica]
MSIKVKDYGYIVEIAFEDIRKLHGIRAYMAIGVGYRILEAAVRELGQGEIISREDIQVITGHGGPGFRDAIEFVTRAVTRDQYTVDPTYPVAQYDPHRPTGYVYIFTLKGEKTIQITLNKSFLPPIFYDYLLKGREESFTAVEYDDNERLKKELCFKALEMTESELITIKEIPTPDSHKA